MKGTAQNPSKSNSKLSISFSNVKSRFDKKPQKHNTEWGALCSLLGDFDQSRGELSYQDYQALNPKIAAEKDIRSQEKDGPGWIPGVLTSGKGRSNEAVEKLSAIVLDLDNGQVGKNEIQEFLGDLEYFAHTTYSHSPEKPKWRVVIPFSKPITPDKLALIFDHFNSLFQGNLDPCGKKPSQLYYFSSCPKDGPFESFRNEGKLFDPQTILDRQPPPKGRHKGSKTKSLIPKPCKDGERHEVFLSAVGEWLNRGFTYERVMSLARTWNSDNTDPWPEDVLISKVKGMFDTDKRNHPERYKPKPWDDIDPPYGYDLNCRGVFLNPKDENSPEIKIASPCWISAKSRDIEGNSWGIFVEWIDSDGKDHKQSIPKERLHDSGNKLAQYLASCGLDIVPGKEKYLLNYLGLFNPQKRFTCVSKLGWVEIPNGGLVYILPLQTISNIDSEEFVYQPETHSPSAHTILSKGSLLDWQTKVALLAQDHPYLIFCICTALAGPLLKIMGLEGGGFHLYGRSSHGKTTAAQMAASVWGCGADPAESPSMAYIRKWNTTANGLEGLAAAHNDGILILDEAGTCNAKDFGKVIYDLTGGQGKVSMTSERALRKPRSWHILILSTGEIPAKQKIEEEGKTARGGQILRMMDIPIEEGVFNKHGRRSGASLAQDIKRSCANFYGTAGPAFLEKLINQFPTLSELSREIRKEYKEAHTLISIKALGPEQSRALQRLALVLAAGKIALKLEILPLEKEELEESILFIRDTWLRDQDNISEGFQGINAVREFILRNPARFADASGNDKEGRLLELAGYQDKQEDLYLFTPGGFKEACNGHNIKEVCRELIKRDLLHINEAGRHTCKHKILGLGRIRLIAVKEEILELDQ
jgi:putative DNA primase/helicase